MPKKDPGFRKVIDDTSVFRCKCGVEVVIREEVFQDSDNTVVKYNLAFIHFAICQKDHGRVLGYDNAHGPHERHFMGAAETVEFTSYESTLARFLDEVARLRREHEKDHRSRKL